jgi:DNA-binding MarR family transcriptional regulator
MSLAIAGIIFILGLVIMFNKPKEKIVIKTIKEKKKKLNLEGLDLLEKKVIEILQSENGAIFQRTLMERLEVGKVGMTRLLDKLESKQLVERKRRGMNNIIVLRQ